MYTQLYEEMSYLDYPILEVETAMASKLFWHPLLTKKPATMTQSVQTTIPPFQDKALGLSCSKINC